MSTLKENSICPQCQKGKLSTIKRNLIFNYKGKSKIFLKEKIFKCNWCDYEGLANNDNERVNKDLADFRKSIKESE